MRSVFNTKLNALKLTKAIKEYVVGRCIAAPMLSLNEHGNPRMLKQFSNHRKSLCEIVGVRVENDVTVR